MPWEQEWKHEENDAELTRTIDPNLERRQPTAAEKERMDRELVTLGTILKDSGIWWQIDGGLNVSLLQDHYIGVHKDIDVSFQRKDIAKLEQVLAQQGYGLFLYKVEDVPDGTQQHILRRVGAEGFKKTGFWRYDIHAIDESGTVRPTDHLTWLDVHVVERDQEGKPYYDEYEQTIMPEEWLNTKEMQFHGVPLKLSNPARFLYFKMFFGRAYDEKDIEQYVKLGAVTLHDLATVERVMQQNFDTIGRREDIMQRLAPEISGILHDIHTPETVVHELLKNTLFRELLKTYGHRAVNPDWIRSRVERFVDRLQKLGNPSREAIEDLLLKPANTDMRDIETRARRRLAKCRQWIQDKKITS